MTLRPLRRGRAWLLPFPLFFLVLLHCRTTTTTLLLSLPPHYYTPPYTTIHHHTPPYIVVHHHPSSIKTQMGNWFLVISLPRRTITGDNLQKTKIRRSRETSGRSCRGRVPYPLASPSGSSSVVTRTCQCDHRGSQGIRDAENT